jgi:peptidoglycan/LPS O-acetylase OafA/YrhL
VAMEVYHLLSVTINSNIWHKIIFNAGIVNHVLSWKGFLPLGRLTYCVFLIHYDYLNVFYSAMRKQYYYTIFGQISIYFGVLVVVFGLAFVISVTLEASFLNLEKLIFSSKPKGKKPTTYVIYVYTYNMLILKIIIHGKKTWLKRKGNVEHAIDVCSFQNYLGN